MQIGTQFIVDNERIPTPPGVAMQLLELSQSNDTTVADLTRVISVDPKLSAKIVSYCNTPLMGMSRETTSLQAAVVILGMRSVTMLALSFSLMDNESDDAEFDFSGFWNRSLAYAISCKLLSKSAGICGDESFLLGLLLNIGQIGIVSTYAAEIAEMRERIQPQEGISEAAILNEFARHHNLDPYYVGGKLLEKWHFPAWMADFVRDYSQADQDETRSKVFRAAERVTGLLINSVTTEAEILETRELFNELLGLDEENFNTNYDKIATEYAEYAKLLEFEVGAVCSISDLETRAKEMLIHASLGMATEIQQISSEREQLKNDSLIDALTGLNNRRAYDEQIPTQIKVAADRKQTVVMAVLDIDHFKRFNDTYGHAAGDAVLKEVSNVVANAVRGSDSVFRFGGEEFVVILANCTQEQTVMIAERIRTLVESCVVEFEGQSLKVTVSSGIVFKEAAKIESLEDIFKEADDLLYKAKELGRNRCQFNFDQDSVAIIPTPSVNVSASQSQTLGS